jgi:membrane protein DedA with SNARE-associated domain
MPEWFADVVTWLVSLDGATIYGIGFGVLLACGLGLPVPEDITLVLMGYMTFLSMPDGQPRPHTHVAVATLVGLTGVMIGDGFMFFLGRTLGNKLAHIWPFRPMLANGRREKAEGFLSKNGPKVLFSARFMPGLRSVVFFTSGTLGIRFSRFLLFDGLAALISVPLLVVSAWYWGAQIQAVIEYARQAEHGLLAVIVAVALIWAAKSWWSSRKKASTSQA